MKAIGLSKNGQPNEKNSRHENGALRLVKTPNINYSHEDERDRQCISIYQDGQWAVSRAVNASAEQKEPCTLRPPASQAGIAS